MSDLRRLKKELETMFYALIEEIEEERPELDRRARREEARTRLLSLVDEALRDVTRGGL